MALSTAGGLASFDMSATAKLDLSEVLARILLADTELLGFLAQGAPATQVTHSWINAISSVHAKVGKLLETLVSILHYREVKTC